MSVIARGEHRSIRFGFLPKFEQPNRTAYNSKSKRTIASRFGAVRFGLFDSNFIKLLIKQQTVLKKKKDINKVGDYEALNTDIMILFLTHNDSENEFRV